MRQEDGRKSLDFKGLIIGKKVTYLTLEEKISHLQTAAMEEARAEGNAIMKQHEAALENIFEQHRIEAIRQ